MNKCGVEELKCPIVRVSSQDPDVRMAIREF